MSATAWIEDDDGNLTPYISTWVAGSANPVAILLEPAFPELEEDPNG